MWAHAGMRPPSAYTLFLERLSQRDTGCKNCYAEGMVKRLQAMRTPAYENWFALKMLPSRLEDPVKRRKPTTYFVNSMSDLFHERIPDEYASCWRRPKTEPLLRVVPTQN